MDFVCEMTRDDWAKAWVFATIFAILLTTLIICIVKGVKRWHDRGWPMPHPRRWGWGHVWHETWTAFAVGGAIIAGLMLIFGFYYGMSWLTHEIVQKYFCS